MNLPHCPGCGSKTQGPTEHQKPFNGLNWDGNHPLNLRIEILRQDVPQVLTHGILKFRYQKFTNEQIQTHPLNEEDFKKVKSEQCEMT